MECRTRGGEAELCGFPEYGTPSSPPKYYRTKTIDGYRPVCDYLKTTANVVCGAPNEFSARDGQRWGGFCSYNSLDCSFTSNTFSKYDFFNTGGCSAVEPTTNVSAPACSADPNVSSGGGWVDPPVITTTSQEWEARSECYETGSTYRQEMGGYWINELSDEDTEDDAINRLLSGGGGTWGSWIAQGATGCDTVPPACCLAKYQQRTGDSFIYQEAEWRVIVTGLSPGSSYSIEVDYWRSAYGANSFSLFQTLTYVSSADGSGIATFTGAVPNEVGYETYPACHV